MTNWIEACAGDEVADEDVSRFDHTSGPAPGAPVRVSLKTYPAEVEGGKIFIDLAWSA